MLVEQFAAVRNQDQLAASLDHALELTSLGVHSCRSWSATRGRQSLDASQDQENLVAGLGGRACLQPSQRSAGLLLANAAEHCTSAANAAATAPRVGATGQAVSGRKFPSVALMNKRQLVGALNFAFLGELKQNLVERLHEFTDCAYTKHEHREAILSLLA